jgi:hypothetical protein
LQWPSPSEFVGFPCNVVRQSAPRLFHPLKRKFCFFVFTAGLPMTVATLRAAEHNWLVSNCRHGGFRCITLGGAAA